MYASIPDALRALARKIGADANGRNEEEILNNIVVKLGGTPHSQPWCSWFHRRYD